MPISATKRCTVGYGAGTQWDHESGILLSLEVAWVRGRYDEQSYGRHRDRYPETHPNFSPATHWKTGRAFVEYIFHSHTPVSTTIKQPVAVRSKRMDTNQSSGGCNGRQGNRQGDVQSELSTH